MRILLNLFSASLLGILALVSTSVLATSPNVEEPRAALVIGNGNYQNGALRNPVNDARAVAAKLEKLGFQVILRENMNREGMHQSIGEFNKLLKEGGVGLFYYAGHGMQIKGRNFLIPVDADIQHEDDIEFRGMDANLVLSRMDSANTRVNLIVLDACRNNPFARGTRSGNLGLAQMGAPKGTLIAFSTEPGSLAKDGDGANSVYTRHLVDKLSIPAMPVEQLFKEVRIAVTKETNDRQIPWESSSLMGDFYFVPPSVEKTLTVPAVLKPVVVQTPSLPFHPAKVVESPKVTPKLVPAQVEPSKPSSKERNYNREGYEIEVRARHLTSDEIPTLVSEAKRGDVIAQTTLGWAYYLGKGNIDGRGIPRSNTQMVRWTKAAAKQGYPVAQNNLGSMYSEGIGVKLDYQMAEHYFKLAADQGYIVAQRNLMDVTAALTGRIDSEMAKSMLKNIQKDIDRGVQ